MNTTSTATGSHVISPSDFSSILRENKPALLKKWVRYVRENVPAAKNKNADYLKDHLPSIVEELIKNLKYPPKTEDLQQSLKLADQHGRQRSDSPEYSVKDIATEYKILKNLMNSFIPSGFKLSVEALEILDTFIEINLLVASEEFLQHSVDEITEYRRLKDEAQFDAAQQMNARMDVEAVMNSMSDQYKKFDALLAAVPDLMVMWNNSARYVYANRAALEAMEMKLEDLVGKSLRDIPKISCEDIVRFERNIEIVRATGKPILDYHSMETRKGLRQFEYELSPIFDGNKEIEGYAAAHRDITERMKAKADLEQAKLAAEQANVAKSIFLANMSHEIRTPIGVVLGFLDLMKQSNTTQEELDKYISVVDRNSTQLLRILDDILDLSKVEAGKMLIEVSPFSLIDTLADFSSMMKTRASELGLKFKIKAETPLPSIIQSDATRIKQILMNIVGNAIKFTEHGSVELTVSFNSGQIEFTVADTGRGMTVEQSSKLFQPFTQADTSTTRKFGGTGLGLVLSKRLCETMGGDFTLVRSDLGKGSIFKATIKAKVPPWSFMVSAEKIDFIPKIQPPSEEIKKTLTGMNILLVEDSLDNQNLIKILLSRAGANVIIANNGEEGVDCALHNDFDAILMDVQMPCMDGHTATQKLREQGCRKPVIALTAHAMNEEREKAKQSGFTDYMTKPISRERLINTLSNYRTVH